MAAHLLGYVSEATDAQLAADNLKSGAIVGQAGIERTHNRDLMGTDGARTVVVNSLGREIRTLDEVEPTEGRRLKLTIDYDVQKAAEDGFKALGFWGAAAAIDPRTGEVLSLVSLPAYDPNSFAGGIDRTTWTALNTDKLRPLQNRVIQGRYSPGSTFKIAVAVAALEEGVVTPDFKTHCSGGATFYGRYFKCHLKGGHGTVDMRHAIEKSCNVYFYTLGNMLGVDKIHKWATRLGLGVKSGIDLPNEVEGIMPSTEWKRKRNNEKWYAGETISVAIGQGQVSVTPISLAVMMATVANGGTRFAPRLVKAYDDGQGWKDLAPPPALETFRFKPSTYSALHDGPVDGGQRLWHRRARTHSRTGRVGQDRHGAGDLAHRPQGGAQFGEGPARPRLVRVLRAARQPGDRRRDLRRALRAWLSGRADCAAHDRHLLREEARRAAAGLHRARAAAADPAGGRSADRARCAAAGGRCVADADGRRLGRPPCSSAACTSTSTGC